MSHRRWLESTQDAEKGLTSVVRMRRCGPGLHAISGRLKCERCGIKAATWQPSRQFRSGLSAPLSNFNRSYDTIAEVPTV